MRNWGGGGGRIFQFYSKNYYSNVLLNSETFFFQLSSISPITMKSFIYLCERSTLSNTDLEVMNNYINIIHVTL